MPSRAGKVELTPGRRQLTENGWRHGVVCADVVRKQGFI